MSWKISTTKLNNQDHLINESLFFTGNGYLGVRGNFEEDFPQTQKTIRGTYLNAFHDTVRIPYGEKLHAFPETQQKLLNIIDSQTIQFFFGEDCFRLDVGEILSFERHLHLDKGFSERITDWLTPSRKRIRLVFKRMVSFIEKEVFIQRIEIESNDYKGPIKIVSILNGDVSNYIDEHDPRVAADHAKLLKVTNIQQSEGISFVECETSNTKLRTACAVSYHLSTPFERSDQHDTVSIASEFIIPFTGKVIFEKKSVFVDTLRHTNNLFTTAMNVQARISTKDFDQFLIEQEEYLRDFWKYADVKISGQQSIQEGIRFNLFHLLQSVGRDFFSNIAAKGLSGEGYEGHYFWDTEIYIFPVFLMTVPEIAKRLLLYRYSFLDQARNHAMDMGHRKGALFPWRTISGTECSSYFPSGSAQYHISADIAYSFIQYFLVSDDLAFIKEYGAELLFETARLWLETGHYDRHLFKIDAITGPDEYTCIVNNNYYTNVMAKYNLHWAVKLYQLLEEQDHPCLSQICQKINLQKTEIKNWQNAAQNMFLPYDHERGINPQDDTFLQKAIWNLAETPRDHFPLLLHYHPLTLYRYQVCKQADTVLAHFLLEDEQGEDTIKNSFAYYENITTHDSSLSTCVFSIMASKLGYKQKAYDYFTETARLDLDNTHGNTKDGLHMANMGGTWLAIVFGFAGLRIKEKGISFNPILPEQWDGYNFSIQYKGRLLRIEKTADHTRFTLLGGLPLPLKVYNQCFILDQNSPLELT